MSSLEALRTYLSMCFTIQADLQAHIHETPRYATLHGTPLMCSKLWRRWALRATLEVIVAWMHLDLIARRGTKQRCAIVVLLATGTMGTQSIRS